MDEELARAHILQRLSEDAAQFQVADHYEQTYAALLDLGARTDISSIIQIRALACAAYGWMPHIIGVMTEDQLQQLFQNADAFSALESAVEGAAFVEAYLNHPLIGNSWVGTSKLLHFLKPEVFPIWDSKVASRFSLVRYYHVNQRDRYLQYISFCAHYQVPPGHPDLQAWWQNGLENFNFPNNQALTNLRVLELILFS